MGTEINLYPYCLIMSAVNEIQRWLISLYPFSEKEIRPLFHAEQTSLQVLFSVAQMQLDLLHKTLL